MKYTKNFYQIKSNTEILKKIIAERSNIGYYNLPYQDTTNIKKYHQKEYYSFGNWWL